MLTFFSNLLGLTKPYRLRLILGVMAGVLGGLAEPLVLLLIPLVGRVVFATAEPAGVSDLLQSLPGFLRTVVTSLTAWLAQPEAAHAETVKVLVICLMPRVVFLRGLFA